MRDAPLPTKADIPRGGYGSLGDILAITGDVRFTPKTRHILRQIDGHRASPAIRGRWRRPVPAAPASAAVARRSGGLPELLPCGTSKQLDALKVLAKPLHRRRAAVLSSEDGSQADVAGAAPKRAAAGANGGGSVGRMQAALASAVNEDPNWKEF